MRSQDHQPLARLQLQVARKVVCPQHIKPEPTIPTCADIEARQLVLSQCARVQNTFKGVSVCGSNDTQALKLKLRVHAIQSSDICPRFRVQIDTTFVDSFTRPIEEGSKTIRTAGGYGIAEIEVQSVIG